MLSPASIWEMAIKVRLGKLGFYGGLTLDDLTPPAASDRASACYPSSKTTSAPLPGCPKWRGTATH